MLFQSVPFLVLMVVTFALYWSVAKHRVARLSVLLLASLTFYAAWDARPLLLFAWYALVNHGFTLAWHRVTTARAKRALVALAVTNHLALLGVFKYADLALSTWGWLGQRLDAWSPPAPVGFLLPIGLSFVAFQAISYVVDVHRGLVVTRHGVMEHLLYLLFFPQVVAGPIVRTQALLERFELVPWLTVEAGGRGLYRIAMGLMKKLLVADVLSTALVNPVFAAPEKYTSAEVLVAVFAYTFQIYFDFSAYSDIAIGASALFGFAVPENFNKPYRATNLFDFWNRWHISLSSWLREYLYIPLGGNRGSKVQVLRNIMVVMVLGGLWHGADWRFAIWGGLHGALLVAWRVWWWLSGKPEKTSALRVAVGFAVTFTAVVFTRVFFRATDLTNAFDVFAQLARLTPGLANVSPQVWATLGVAVVSHYVPDDAWERLGAFFVWLPAPARAAALVALGLVLKAVSTFEAQPYIYFQF
ncbi:MAG: MBOAT family protein [Myxococcus sp.]|nr:MBOAT family protein [Myxococcus sp.]